MCQHALEIGTATFCKRCAAWTTHGLGGQCKIDLTYLQDIEIQKRLSSLAGHILVSTIEQHFGSTRLTDLAAGLNRHHLLARRPSSSAIHWLQEY